jgi:tetratricopeptide (TPR) repeat protein
MRARRLALLLAALFFGTWAVQAVADSAADRKAALREAQEGLRDRRWPEAAQALGALRARWPGTEEATEAWVLEARALLQAGQAREALDATTAFLTAHGQDLWAGRMRHTAAEAYAALRDHAKASETLHQLAEEATAPEARAKIGALYLALADGDFDGVEAKDDLGRTIKKRDVQGALGAYRQALAVGLAPADMLRAREREALSLEELGDAAGALAVWTALIAAHDTEKAPAAPELAERWLVGRGRAALKAGQLELARTSLAKALERFPRGKLALETLRLLGEERLTARDGGVDDLAFEEGVRWLRRAVLEHREAPGSLEAQRRLAEAYESRGQSEKAAQEWGALVDRAPNDKGAPEARDRAAQALAQAGRFDDAVAEWNRFLTAYPNHPLWPSVREKIASAAFEKAHVLLAHGDTAGAVAAWKQFAEQRPEDPRAPAGLDEAAQALRVAKDPEAAVALWRALAGRYANTPHAAGARLKVALTLEDDLGRLEDAVAAYEEVVAQHAGSDPARQAQERLARLKSKHLELRMERVLGSAEAPTLRVVTRNVEALKVRVYRLGLEEYFRRKGTLDGVEALQLEVVKPDLSSEWKIEGYKPFQLLEADRPLPLKGVGAYVVVAGDDELTGTVLTLVSDVECVVKRGQGADLLVWAFVRGTQAPVVGARVLAAHGDGVKELGLTGKDGVWHGEANASFADRLLVLSEQGAAGSGIQAGPATASGFSSRAFVATDRPVYRPGQEIAWRAIYLTAAANRYAIEPGVKAHVSLIDARGQTLEQQDVTASDLGTLSGSFSLDGEAALGRWRVRLAIGRSGVAAEGAFEVQEYRKPEFTVDVLPKRASVLTGEKIEATIRLEYAFGGPVPGAEVEWVARRQRRTFEAPAADDVSWYVRSSSDAQDREKAEAAAGAELVGRGRARTAEDGTLAISFEAGGKDEDAEIVVLAQAEDVTRRWVTGSGRVAVTRRDHLASVGTDLAVVKPKQPVTVEVRTLDPLGGPVSRSGALLLQRVRRVPAPRPPGPPVPAPRPPGPLEDRRGGARPLVEEEVEVASYPLTTDARGRAEIRVECPEPGRWRLRWRSLDARGGSVTAFRDVEAAGEAQDLSKDARLVAAKMLHVEGEEAELLLSTPVGQGLALVTFEAERVLEHRFVSLAGTSTLLRLPVKGDHAPNVTVAVALPGKEGLLTASADLVVLRRLQVSVRFAKAVALPGEEVEVEVTTLDASGKPVAAEVGLSVLDAALYEIAPDATPAILPFFFGARRGHGVSTASSLGWRTYGTTRPTNADLLADDAARGGDAEAEMARSALRLAREALRQGDIENAVAQVLKAQEADPGSWDARVLLGELRARPEAEKSFRRLEAGAAGDELARKLADGTPLAAMLPAAAPAPSPAEAGASCGAAGKSCGEPAQDAAIGVGGGAGGASKGRGGRLERKSGGGGAQARASIASMGRSFDGDAQLAGGLLADKADALAGYPSLYLQDFDAFAAPAEAPALRSDLRDSALWRRARRDRRRRQGHGRSCCPTTSRPGARSATASRPRPWWARDAPASSYARTCWYAWTRRASW